MRPLNFIATEASIFGVKANNFLHSDSFLAKKWNSTKLLSRNGNEVHYVVHCSHLLVFVNPMSTYQNTIFIITKDLVGMTFIVHVMSRPNSM